ncbi:MAG: hypothetical protein HN341_07290 [Verrucomicrobia bacterium]|jgi:uroporphyrinogen decarboxylase|nr:hypothetical protein [Verrucomicrobiota bacterium]
MMTPRDIVLANLNHTGAPRPGMTFDGDRVNDMLGVGIGASQNYTRKRWTEGDKEYYDDEWGNLWVRFVGGCANGEVVTAALPSWDGLDALKMPDYEDSSRYESMKETFAQPTDKFKLAHIGGWIFDNARYLRTMEVYFMDMAMYPDELKQLHSKVAKVYEAKIHGAGSAGADGIMIGEDMGTQTGLLFSPDMFREFFKEEYTRLIDLAHEFDMKVLMHSCGMNWEIIDDLIDCGIDCFQFDQPALYDMPALAATLRERKVALWSPTDIQRVLPTGDREFIESETRRMLDTFEGCLITKNYPDLPGIGVKPEWDMWAYNVIAERT